MNSYCKTPIKKPATLARLFSNPKRWVRFSYFVGKNGETLAKKRLAYACCLAGGVELVYGRGRKAKAVTKSLKRVISDVSGSCFVLETFNDKSATKHADLLAVVKKAKV